MAGAIGEPFVSSTEFKNDRSYTSTPRVCFHGVDRDRFIQRIRLHVEKLHTLCSTPDMAGVNVFECLLSPVFKMEHSKSI